MFKSYMSIALEEARAAASRGEIPVGAVVISDEGIVVAKASNRTRELCDPSAHAEVLAIRAACRNLKQERLTDFDLFVTLEPCSMCAGLIAAARIKRLYYGASDPKSGGVERGAQVLKHAQSHHVPEVYAGVGEEESRALLQNFFETLRGN